MRRLVESPEARLAVVDLLEWSQERFGLEAASRYRRLIQQAYADLAEGPLRPSSTSVGRPAQALWSYHVKFSRHRVRADRRVDRPKHLLIYRFDDAQVDILGVLHERMDIANHIRKIR